MDSTTWIIEQLKDFREKLSNNLFRLTLKDLITERDRDIFYFRHAYGKTYEETGKEFNLTRERIRQIDYKILEIFKIYKK